MPLYSIQGPDGKTYSIEGPEGASREEVIDAIEYKMRQQPATQRIEKPEEVGIFEGAKAALGRGIESFGDIAAGYGLAGSKLFGAEEETRRRMEEIKREQAVAPEVPMMTIEDFERIAAEKGVLEAAKEAPKYILEQLGLSGPQMATPLAVGAGTTAVTGNPLIGTLAGIGTYGLQQFGNFLITQAVEKNDPEELDLAKAALAAGGTAPIGYFVDKFVVGLGSIGKKAGSEAAKELAARQIAVQTGKRVAQGATIGVIAEAPTEVLEQVAERWQAGKDLVGEDANREYKEAFFGAAAVGGTIGGVTRGYAGYREAKEAGAAPEVTTTEPQTVSRNTFQVTDFDGNPSTVEVTEDSVGNIIARDDKGEEVDLTNIISRGTSVEDAVRQMFSIDEEISPIEPVEAPAPVAPPRAAGPELITPTMADIPPRQVPTSYLPDREPTPPEAPKAPEPPKLLGYSPTAGQEPMYVFSDGSVAIGEEAAFNRRYEPQKLSQEELSLIEPQLEEAPDFEGVEFRVPDQKPLPITPEEKAQAKEKKENLKLEEKRLRELERRYAALTRAPGKGEDLRKFLYRQLNEKSSNEIGEDVDYYKASKGRAGKSLESFIEDGLLNPWLPENLWIDYRTDSPEVMLDKEKEGYDYIIDKLRGGDFFTEAAKNEASRVYDEISATIEYMEKEIGFENLRDILAEIYEEEIARGFEPGESEYTEAGAPEAVGTTRIESAAQREGLSAAPKVPVGMIRLYRAESKPDAEKKSPADWIRESEEYKRTLEATGRWFTDDLSEAQWYLDNEYPGGRITYIDVPKALADQFKVSNIPEKVGGKQAAESPKAFSRRPEKEFFVSKEVAEKRLELTPQQREERAIADRERELFALQPQVGERVGAPTADMFGAEGIQQIRPGEPKGRAAAAEQLSLFNSDKERIENPSDGTVDKSINMAEAQMVQKAIEGKSAIQVARWLADNAPDADQRLFALRSADRMQKLMNAGVKFNFKVAHVGDKVPSRLVRSSGLSSATLSSRAGLLSVDIWVNGTDVGGKRVGTDFETVLHEIIHSVTQAANYMGRRKDMAGTQAAELSKRLNNLSNAVIKHYNARVAEAKKTGNPSDTLPTDLERRIYRGANALDDSDEVLAWGLTSQEMKQYLESIPYKGTTAWGEFVNTIRKFLGLPLNKETALSELLAISDLMFEAPLVEVGQTVTPARVAPAKPIPSTEQIELFSAKVAGMSADQKGKMALDIIDTLGRAPEPDKTIKQKVNEIFRDDRGNLKITPESAKKETARFLDKVETYVFSSDAAINNAILRSVMDSTKSQQEKIGALLSVSSSQAVHADAIASLFMRYGGIKYNPEIYKYEAVDRKENLISLVKAIDNLASTYKMTKQQAERVAHTAFEAKRLRSLQQFNDDLDYEIESLRAQIKQAKKDGNQKAVRAFQNEVRRKAKDYKFIHMTDDEIAAGLRLIELMPKEMNQIIDTWNGIRLSAGRELVSSGLWSVAETETLLSNMDYVPFYREEQLEQGRGPKEFLRNLQVQAKEKKLKGSKMAVNDVFDNMARWTQYAVKRSVMNRLAVAKIDAAVEAKIARKVDESKKDRNSVRVWRNGEASYYNLDDPMFMEAFAGLEGVSIPTWKIAAKFSNFLRQSVVLNPLFSVSQVPQDAFAAIYTSGLKPRYALSIPIRALKEFVLTLTKMSKTNKELERIGVVGIRDFTSAIARSDAEVAAGLKAPPGALGKAKAFLEHFSMASDNAVRQAVYNAAIAQGVSRAEALEKAFQLINFRNRGSSKAIALAGQVIPFFNAYLAAQHVAIKTISGVGISPGDRAEALKTLIYTTASVTALSLVYSMMMDDDEEYKNTPSIIRDRLLMIPGVKMSIPLRSDIFAIPKILTEHLYMINTNQGSADGRKFRDSIKAALANSLFSPTVVPQAVKPLVEVGINYNFYQGRPLIGTYQKGLETERQFNDSTSELAKVLGSTGIISPIAADHMIRGMFGSVGGLTLLMTNQVLHNDPSVPRPEMTTREIIAALPSTSGFVRREYETGIKNDFYVLRDEVSKAVNTLNDLKARSPHEIEEFLADEKNINRLGLQKATNQITQNLSMIRREISRITQLPASAMSAKEKQQAIKDLRQIEQDMLSGIDIKELRRIAQL